MREGFYKVEYAGQADSGFALLALDTGAVVGADWAGGRYDGTYRWNEQTQLLDMEVVVSVPEGVQVVQGHMAGPGGLKFDARCSFPRDPESRIVEAATDLGPVAVRITLLRAFD